MKVKPKVDKKSKGPLKDLLQLLKKQTLNHIPKQM